MYACVSAPCTARRVSPEKPKLCTTKLQAGPRVAHCVVCPCPRFRRVGAGSCLRGPFGARRLLYADTTASGRCLSSIEDHLRDEVMPLYANTHSSASACGLQTSQYVDEARQLVKNAFNCTDKGGGTGNNTFVVAFTLPRAPSTAPHPSALFPLCTACTTVACMASAPPADTLSPQTPWCLLATVARAPLTCSCACWVLSSGVPRQRPPSCASFRGANTRFQTAATTASTHAHTRTASYCGARTNRVVPGKRHRRWQLMHAPRQTWCLSARWSITPTYCPGERAPVSSPVVLTTP